MDLSKDLKYIKKKYGEQMMHYCRECFPTILNMPGKLVEILNTHFYCVRDSLYIDIVNNHKEEEFNVEFDFDNNKYKVFTRDHSGQKEVTESLSAEDKEELLDDLIMRKWNKDLSKKILKILVR